ncbi:unnamed protein product, partial [Cladocopium goreaui]
PGKDLATPGKLTTGGPRPSPVMVINKIIPLCTVSIYGFLNHGMDDFLYLQAGEASWLCSINVSEQDLSPLILELCAGMGGMGIGASFLGGMPSLSIDSNELACCHLMANSHGKVLKLDINQALLMPHAWRTYGLHQWPDSSPYHQVVGDLFKCWGQRTAGTPARPAPPTVFAVGITHLGAFDMCFLNAGQFLFEALRSLDIQMVNFLMDMEGKVDGADFRVWKTMRLTTLQNWPPTMPLRAAGQRAHHMDPSTMLQLHAGHVDMAATELAAWISDELSLGWALDPGHLFQQSDDHACGTVALLHVGVPTAYCECSKKCPAAIKKLGAPSIANPWHALKALTSKPGNNFQYVLRSDLMDFMDSKAASKRGAQISMQKKKKKKKDKKQNKTPSAPPVAPDPSTIQLNPAHFIDDERDQVEQIPLAQVTADSRGLAEIPHNLKSQANVVSICFPATYLPTSDPLLINDCLLQLGDHPISRQKVQDPANSMDLAATNVLKIQLFRDELGSIWEAAVEDSMDQMMLDLWGRLLMTKYEKGMQGIVQALHEELLSYWTPTWQAMSTVEPSTWNWVIAFFQAHVPQLQMQLGPISPDQWFGALRKYRTNAARGVDGISPKDLLSLPMAWTLRLLDLLHAIELGQSDWPTAILYGVVNVLAKDEGASTVDRFRPVVAWLGALQSGAFMDRAAQAHFDMDKDSLRPLCGVKDTQSHWLDCPRYAWARAEVECWQNHHGHDAVALRSHLLPSRSPFAAAWKRALLEIPDTTGPEELSEPNERGDVSLFGLADELQISFGDVYNLDANELVSTAWPVHPEPGDSSGMRRRSAYLGKDMWPV